MDSPSKREEDLMRLWISDWSIYSVREILTSSERTLGGPISEMPERIILAGESIISSLLVSWLTVSQTHLFIRKLWALIIVQWVSLFHKYECRNNHLQHPTRLFLKSCSSFGLFSSCLRGSLYFYLQLFFSLYSHAIYFCILTMKFPPLSALSDRETSLDSLQEISDIQEWVRDFFQQCSETVLPAMSSEDATNWSFVYDAPLKEGAYRIKWNIRWEVRIISEFEFPGQAKNSTLRILPNRHIEGRFPDGSSSPKLSFNTSVKNWVLNMKNIREALWLAQAALESLQDAGEIVWTVESTGVKVPHTVPDILTERSGRVAQVLAG